MGRVLHWARVEGFGSNGWTGREDRSESCMVMERPDRQGIQVQPIMARPFHPGLIDVILEILLSPHRRLVAIPSHRPHRRLPPQTRQT